MNIEDCTIQFDLMQIETVKQESEEKQEIINYNNKIVSIDYSLSLLRNSKIKDIRGCSSSNPWPLYGFNFLERSVISTQLWLHKIDFLSVSETKKLIEIFENRINCCNTNYQFFIVYDSELKLNLIFNSEIKWVQQQPFLIKIIRINNYIEYLIPLTKITKRPIISTIIARKEFCTQHILAAEIVSIGEFRPFYIENKQIWRYYKETKEAYRNHKFKYFHHYELYKAINYRVQQRVILSLNRFIYLEIIIVKDNYFVDINQYYSGQHQLTLPSIAIEEFQIQQPHQIDYFGTLDKVTTEYFPQQH